MTTKIKKTSAVPMYRQIADKIRADIVNSTYKIDEKIPTEVELIEKYDVSRITIRKAIDELCDEGILTRRQGKGTFVTIPAIDVDIKAVTSFSDACAQRGQVSTSKVIGSRSIRASAEDMEKLHVSADARVIEIDRLRYADNEPVIIERNHFTSAFSYLLESNLSGSLYTLLRSYGIEPSKAEHEVSIISADDAKARLLGINPGDPILFLYEVIYDQKGRPLHISRQYGRGDKYTLKI